MNLPRMLLRLLGRALVAAAVACSAVSAHDFSVGDIEITHPFATPSPPGMTTGAAYFAALANNGARPDKLLHASTPVSASVELHNMNVDAQGVMRMREIDGVELAPKATVKMRPGMGMHLMLVGLKKPLKEGDTFAMSLQFERAGKVDVKFVVQTPQGAMADMHGH